MFYCGKTHIWYNWHFSSFKVTTQWHYAPSRCCATIASVQLAAFRVSKRKSPPRKYSPHPLGVQWGLTRLWCVSHMRADVEHLFMCCWPSVSLLWLDQCPSSSFLCLIGLQVFCWLSCQASGYQTLIGRVIFEFSPFFGLSFHSE